MTLMTQSECCLHLGIDPKTLRAWLRHDQIAFLPHPTDACQKCLTDQQLRQLATDHQRPLLAEPSLAPAVSAEGRLAQTVESLQAQMALVSQHLVLLTQEI